MPMKSPSLLSSSMMRAALVSALFVLTAACGRTEIGQRCDSDSQCPEGGQCVSQICVTDELPDVDEPDTDTDADVGPELCESDLECGSGECSTRGESCAQDMCDLELGHCVETECPVSCEEGELQLGCRCVAEVCESDAQCDGLICDAGTCRGCEVDSECGDTQLCQAGECVAGPECQIDNDCRPSEVCVEESCVE